jgi:transcriptional regulator with XRE-family HTH domain
MPAGDFARSLQRTRIGKGYRTMRAFALETGINENTYARYERGQAVPLPATLELICKRLGIAPEHLLQKDDAKLEQSSSASQGFDDNPQRDLTQVSSSDGAATSAADRDLTSAKIWRVAAILSRVRGLQSADYYKTTAKTFLALRRDPLGELALILSEADASAMSKQLGDELDRAIAALVRHIETAKSR